MVEDMGIKTEASYFDGELLQLIGWYFVGSLITILTFGICYPWAICMIKSWEAKHTVVSGRRLRFNGTAMQLFGTWIKWLLLTLVTFGIYGLWLPIKTRQWTTKHTVLDEPVTEDISDEESYEYEEDDQADDTTGRRKSPVVVGALALVLLLGLAGIIGAVRGDRESEYLDKVRWASPQSYMFAVEADGFDGDNFKAGTFNFTSEIKVKNKIPAVFDVYVSPTEYSKAKDVKPEEMVGSVGGVQSDSVSVDIPAGNYVYLVYNPVIGNDPGNVICVSVNPAEPSNKLGPTVKAEATPDPDEQLRDAVEEYLAQAYGEDRPVRIRIQQSFVDAKVLSETEQSDGMPDNWAEIRDATVEVNSGMAEAFPEGCGRQCAVLSLVDKNRNNLLVVKDGKITWDVFSAER